MTTAAIQKTLPGSAPTVFINACRSAGLAATYNRLDGWASKFLEGRGRRVHRIAVGGVRRRPPANSPRNSTSTPAASSLGEAVQGHPRRRRPGTPDDPTWLAYTVYGDPRAKVSQPIGW